MGRYKFLLVPSLVIFLFVFSLLFFVPKSIIQIKNDFNVIKKTRGTIKDLKAKYLLISSLDIELLKKQASLAKKALPEEKDVAFILTEVRNVAANSGFIIKNLKFTPGGIEKDPSAQKLKKKQVEQLPLEVKMVGRVADLKNLLLNIESAFPIFEIESFKSTLSSNEFLTIELKLLTFYSPPLVAYKNEAISLEDLILSEKETSFLQKLEQFEKFEDQNGGEQPEGSSIPRENPFTF